jgi:CheY-like chemotaxis protein
VIDDLLDVSRILTGKLRLSARTIAVAEAVRAGIDSVRPSALAKQVTIVENVDPDIRIIGDPDRLQQVVWNLLTNAVKFTPRGGAVSVSLSRSESQATIVVRDSGEGIDAEFLPHVFEPFRQADGSKARVHKGLGLGLSIVKYIVEAHGGTVAASSAGKGEGTTFRVSLPIMPFVRSEPAGEAPHFDAADIRDIALPHGDSLTETTILVVDDHKPTLDVLTTTLRRAGADAVGASSVAEGLQLFHRICPDVVVSDIGMPGEDGLSFIAKLRALPKPCSGARAIALTAYARREDRDAILSSGFDAYLAKPVEPVELVNTIQNLLSQGEAI